jgi:putative nucleotidyltransferase with HDIG domain
VAAGGSMAPERIGTSSRAPNGGAAGAGGADAGDPRLRADLMKRLVELSETLNRLSSVAGVATAIGQAAADLSGAGRVAVFLRSASGVVTCPWSRGLSASYVGELCTPDDAAPWAHLTRHAELACMDLPKSRRAAAPEPVLVDDIRTLPAGNDTRRRADREGIRAFAAWPLVHEGRAGAAVACYYDAPRTWSAPEREAMQAFAWQAAAALENGRSYEAQGRRTAELEALYELSKRLRRARTPDEMYPILIDHVVRLLHADHGSLALLSPDGATLTTVHAWGLEAERTGTSAPASPALTRMFSAATPHVTPDLSAEEAAAFSTAPEIHATLGPYAVAAVRADEDVIGTMAVARARRGQREPFVEADLRVLKSIAETAGAAIHRSRLYHNLQDSYIQMVLTLVRALDARDSYTGGHSERLAEWAEATARVLGCRDEEAQDIRWGALLHDIGKIAVPDAILRKPARLTDEEWQIMRQHPVTGEEILRPLERMRGVARILRHHHERWDGTGYPDGLSEERIPLGARILAVVDAYSAITDERPYKPARSHIEAVAELRRSAGTQFDLRVVEAFCKMLEQRTQAHAPVGESNEASSAAGGRPW